ncbi:MAG TPA: hypothetical protein VH165_02425 [Kofleriaceae bacterium]|nr:hypothetical protein [Kofleriaceae bacterium]
MDLDHHDLPFLIVHGAAVWKLLLVGLVALVALLHGVWRRVHARRAARAAVSALDRETGEGVVRGTLGGEGVGPLASTLIADKGPAHDERAPEIWIETADGRVALEGAIRVVTGSRAAAARNGVPRATSDALLGTAPALHRVRGFWAAKLRVATLVSVAAGDEVIARGRIERTASDEPSDYRVGKAALTLHALEDAPIMLVANTPRVAVPRMSLLATVVLLGLVAGVGYKVELMLGESWRDTCRELAPSYGEPRSDAVENAPIELTNTHACALAAAMPDRRERVLDATLELLERHSYRDAATLRQTLELARFTNNCDRQRRMSYGRYEDVVAEARRCDDRHTEHLALLAQGKLDEAVAIIVPEQADPEGGTISGLPDGAEWIATGHWREAALAADAKADAIRKAPHEARYREAYELQTLHHACLAELFRHYAGDPAAAGRLRALATNRSGACASVLAQIAPAEERRELLKWRSGAIDNAITVDLSWADGANAEPFEIESAEAVLADPTDYATRASGPLIWLARTVPPPGPAAEMMAQVSRLRWQAVGNVFDGDLAAATANANAALALAGPSPHAELAAIAPERERIAKDSEAAHANHDQLVALDQRYKALVQRETVLEKRSELRDVSLLPAVVALYTPATALAFDLGDTSEIGRKLWSHDFARLSLRRGDPVDKDDLGDSEFLAALQAAGAGDGRPLARRIGGVLRTRWKDADVIAVLPRIRIGREAVVRQLTWSRPLQWDLFDHAPLWAPALYAVTRREVLRLAGATDAAAAWDAIYRRFDRVFRDRQRLVALMLWQMAN